MKDHQRLTNDFHRAVKIKNAACKVLRFCTKMKKIVNIFKKILRFFDQHLYRKLTFSQFFTKYFLKFCLFSKSIHIPLEDKTSLLQQFFLFLGGGTFMGSPLPRLLSDCSITGYCYKRGHQFSISSNYASSFTSMIYPDF